MYPRDLVPVFEIPFGNSSVMPNNSSTNSGVSNSNSSGTVNKSCVKVHREDGERATGLITGEQW